MTLENKTLKPNRSLNTNTNRNVSKRWSFLKLVSEVHVSDAWNVFRGMYCGAVLTGGTGIASSDVSTSPFTNSTLSEHKRGKRGWTVNERNREDAIRNYRARSGLHSVWSSLGCRNQRMKRFHDFFPFFIIIFDRASRYIHVMKTNFMHYLSLGHFVNQPLSLSNEPVGTMHRIYIYIYWTGVLLVPRVRFLYI